MLEQRSVAKKLYEPARLYFSFARDPSEVAEAQRLRYKVFAEEMGAKIHGKEGYDQDGFDAFCDHLLVRDSLTQSGGRHLPDPCPG